MIRKFSAARLVLWIKGALERAVSRRMAMSLGVVEGSHYYSDSFEIIAAVLYLSYIVLQYETKM